MKFIIIIFLNHRKRKRARTVTVSPGAVWQIHQNKGDQAMLGFSSTDWNTCIKAEWFSLQVCWFGLVWFGLFNDAWYQYRHSVSCMTILF